MHNHNMYKQATRRHIKAKAQRPRAYQDCAAATLTEHKDHLYQPLCSPTTSAPAMSTQNIRFIPRRGHFREAFRCFLEGYFKV